MENYDSILQPIYLDFCWTTNQKQKKQKKTKQNHMYITSEKFKHVVHSKTDETSRVNAVWTDYSL